MRPVRTAHASPSSYDPSVATSGRPVSRRPYASPGPSPHGHLREEDAHRRVRRAYTKEGQAGKHINEVINEPRRGSGAATRRRHLRVDRVIASRQRHARAPQRRVGASWRAHTIPSASTRRVPPER